VQSTYCSGLFQHCETVGRRIHMVNLDPAAEHFSYPVSTGKTIFLYASVLIFRYASYSASFGLIFVDIRDLISLDDVMEELGMGPNGGLIYCMEYPIV
jgi:hypothetical protein